MTDGIFTWIPIKIETFQILEMFKSLCVYIELGLRVLRDKLLLPVGVLFFDLILAKKTRKEAS